MRIDRSQFLTANLLAIVVAVTSLLLSTDTAHAAPYVWDGTNNTWPSLHWNPGSVSGPTTSGNTADINSGIVSFTRHDTFGNANLTSSPAITIGTGGQLNSAGWFTPMWNLTLSGGTLHANGGDGNWGSYGLAGTVTVNGSSPSTISSDGGGNSRIDLKNVGTTFQVADVTGNATADLTVSAVIANGNDGNWNASRLIKTGPGTLFLNPGGAGIGANPNVFSGGATLAEGEIQLNSAAQNGLGTGSFTIMNNTTIGISGNNVHTLNNSQYNLNGDFTVLCKGGHTLNFNTGNVTLGTNVTASVVNASRDMNLNIPGTIDDGGNGYGLTKDGTGTLWLSGTNTYTGKTGVLDGTLHAKIIANEGIASSLGAPTGADATIDLYGGASLRAGRPTGNSNTTDRVINLAGDGGTTRIYIQDNDTNLALNGDFTATGTGAKTLALSVSGDRPSMTVNGAIPNVSDGSPLSLDVYVGGNQQTKGIILGGVNTYTGNTTVSHGSGTITDIVLTLADNAGLLFDIGPSGNNNRLTGDGVVNLDGDFTFDLTDAGMELGDLWQIVDTSGGLVANYGSTFSVDGFTDAGSDLWSFSSGAADYQFSELTGALSVIGVAAVPEPSAILLGALGLLGLLWQARRRRAD